MEAFTDTLPIVCNGFKAKLRIKTVGQHFINLSFYFTGTNPRFVRSMSQMKTYSFLNPRKIAIQHLTFCFTVKSAQTRAIYLYTFSAETFTDCFMFISI